MNMIFKIFISFFLMATTNKNLIFFMVLFFEKVDFSVQKNRKIKKMQIIK